MFNAFTRWSLFAVVLRHFGLDERAAHDRRNEGPILASTAFYAKWTGVGSIRPGAA